MNAFTKLIQEDMKPALGVTEPGAIAYACARARSYTESEVARVTVTLNSGMYKNAFTCGIPNSPYVGNRYAAALGIVAGRWENGLEALSEVTAADNEAAQRMIGEGKIDVRLGDISSRIDINVCVETEKDECCLHIRDKHTHVVEILLNGTVIFTETPMKSGQAAGKGEAADAQVKAAGIVGTEAAAAGTGGNAPGAGEEIPEIHRHTLAEILEYCGSVPLEELVFLREAYEVNLQLFEAGRSSERTRFLKSLLRANGGRVISDQELPTAQLLCNGTIEARVIGLEKPAMSITGSGAHGIICTMPLYAVCQVNGYPEEKLLRATALSYLVTMYIKEYSGRLSAFCGCAIAAGTGMACACVYLKGGGLPEMHRTVNNMASSITGMICDGGNQGCAMKGVVAVDAAFRSVGLAMEGVCVDDVHGINSRSTEDTFRYMGRIASPGMVETEGVIVGIFEEKQAVDGKSRVSVGNKGTDEA